MNRKIILASHHKLADGMADTLNFITGNLGPIKTLCAYMDNKPIEQQVKRIVESEPGDTELIILTDMMSGSVNQKFIKYLTRPHTHLICGVNLPLALAFIMEPKNQYLSEDQVEKTISQAKDSISYINKLDLSNDDEDE